MSKETCYVCQLPLKKRQGVYVLKDAEGLIFYGHKDCVETKMALVGASGEKKL